MSSCAETEVRNSPTGWEGVDLYRFFAFVFGPPSAERFEWFRRPDLAASLDLLRIHLGCAASFPGGTPYKDYDEYESTYIAVFDVGLPEPPVPLLESAHHKSVPAQETALENVFFYDVLGLKTETARLAPEHLVTQLEFLAAVRYARENATTGENRTNLVRLESDFLERHLLNWLPVAQEKLNKAQPPLFPLLLSMLLAFLRQRFSELAHGR